MAEPRTTICVFAKPPEPGRVKTRLAPAIGEAAAAELAWAFLRDTVSSLRTLPWADVVLVTTGPLPAPLGPPEWTQGDGDLGDRMERALARALRTAPRAMVVGTDSPGLLHAHLHEAHRALATTDAVLGPADDGGFYLIGLTRCPEGLLAGLPWSREDTLARTRARLTERGLRATLAPSWFDVDRPEDLTRLRRELDAGLVRAPETHRLLRALSEGAA